MTEYSNGQRLRVTRSCCGIVREGDIVTVIGTRRTRSERNSAEHSWETIHWNSGEYLTPVSGTPTYDYAVGTELRLLPNAKCMEYSQTEGDTPTGGVFFDSSVSRVRVLMKHNKGNYSVRRLDGEGRDAQIVHESFLAPLDATPILDASLGIPAPTVTDRAVEADLRQQVTTLRGQLEEAQQRAQQAWMRHQRDIQLIGETMMEAAAENDMCNVYDENVERLNRDLHIELPVRAKSYRVRIEFVQYITVEAADEDSALETAQESDEYMDSDYLEETDTDVREDD